MVGKKIFIKQVPKLSGFGILFLKVVWEKLIFQYLNICQPLLIIDYADHDHKAGYKVGGLYCTHLRAKN